MRLLGYLMRNARGVMLFTGVMALLSGACNAGLIAVVNHVLTREEPAVAAVIWCFAALAAGKLLTAFLSQNALARFAQGAMARIRLDLVRSILAAPLRHLEELGAGRLMAALTDDVMSITQALSSVPILAVNLAILLGGGVYLAWLSWEVLLLAMGFIFLGALGYRAMIRRGFARLADAREQEDQLFGHFRGLTEGTKELKLHRERREVFVEARVRGATDACREHNIAAELRFILAHGWGHLLVFTLIGLILFGLPYWQRITPQALTGYVITMLYLMGPLAGVMGSLAVFGRATVSFRKVEQLRLSLSDAGDEDRRAVTVPFPVSFKRLELAGVTHAYHHEGEDHEFALGPVDLVFEPGELVFLVGGNGSGKSTLAKIITGLYPPEEGEIHLDDQLVNDANRDAYRQCFAAVFSDFHVFEELIGLGGPRLDDRAARYLRELHLHHKVSVRQGRLSTTALSQGQRKRLALLTAWLEDRPFYLFDEWASDQDPLFKDIFYTELLPDLKARGKAVLVITHDEKYFQRADRILKLDYGQLVYDKRVESRVRDAVLQH
jgi:putative pyoverdin transport system ATP-binding/permease protein